jgi:hypothetical protein
MLPASGFMSQDTRTGVPKKRRPGRMRRVIRGRPEERGSGSGLVNERQRPRMSRLSPCTWVLARARELPMFRHTDYLQFDAKPEKPDPVYARKLQELICLPKGITCRRSASSGTSTRS